MQNSTKSYLCLNVLGLRVLVNMLTLHLAILSHIAEYHVKAITTTSLSRTVQSIHLIAGPVIKSFRLLLPAVLGCRAVECQPDGCTHDTDPEVKANAENLTL